MTHNIIFRTSKDPTVPILFSYTPDHDLAVVCPRKDESVFFRGINYTVDEVEHYYCLQDTNLVEDSHEVIVYLHPTDGFTPASEQKHEIMPAGSH